MQQPAINKQQAVQYSVGLHNILSGSRAGN